MKKRVLYFLAMLFFSFSLDFTSAAFVDNGSLSQIAYDCGTLNTSGAVYTLNQSISVSNLNCFNIVIILILLTIPSSSLLFS